MIKPQVDCSFFEIANLEDADREEQNLTFKTGAKPTPLYTRIYNVVRQVPPGKVVAYGQIANMLGGCSARQVGYAMAALKDSKEMLDVPWQRVINSQGRCSSFGGGIGTSMQMELLRQEGIRFDDLGRVTDAAQWWLEKPL